MPFGRNPANQPWKTICDQTQHKEGCGDVRVAKYLEQAIRVLDPVTGRLVIVEVPDTPLRTS